MPNPDLRERNADPNDPDNIHTARAANPATVPPRSGSGLVLALIAVVAIVAIVYFVMAGSGPDDGATVSNDVRVEEPAETPAAGGSEATSGDGSSAPANGNGGDQQQEPAAGE